MAKEKERFEVLLEEIRGDVKLVLEGHAALDKKVEDVKDLVKAVDTKVEDTGKAVKFVADKVNKIDRTLEEHVHLPAHA